MNTKQLINYGSIVLSGIGIISLCVGIHMTAKKMSKNINDAIDNLSNRTSWKNFENQSKRR